MSSIAAFVIAGFYFITAVIIGFKEKRVITRTGGDSFTIIFVFLFINFLLPGIGIYLILGIFGPDLRTGTAFFDQVIFDLTFIDSLAVCLLLILFILGLYSTAASSKRFAQPNLNQWNIEMRGLATILILAGLLTVCTTFFLNLGENFLERYGNLILYRIQSPLIERTAFSANAFTLTQTLTLLSAGVSFIYLAKNRYIRFVICLILVLYGGFLMGSRRGLILPILIIYLCSVLWNRKLYMKTAIFLVPFFIAWISFGKEFTGSHAYNSQIDLQSSYSSYTTMLLRAFSDIGISLVESLAVFQNFSPSLPRLGIDHLLSVLRRLPDGMLGLDIDWPQRIVRTTTEVFTHKDDADLPPGLIGQSWLDLPVLGSFFWGLFIGLQCRLLNSWARNFRPSPAKIALMVLLSFIIALPLNTGSYDFTFSIDIIVLALLMLIVFGKYRSPKSA